MEHIITVDIYDAVGMYVWPDALEDAFDKLTVFHCTVEVEEDDDGALVFTNLDDPPEMRVFETLVGAITLPFGREYFKRVIDAVKAEIVRISELQETHDKIRLDMEVEKYDNAVDRAYDAVSGR